MAETLFSLDRRNVRECQKLFRGERSQEYYLGDYWLDEGPSVEVKAERKSVGPISIIRMTTSPKSYFRRTRQHIREDATDLAVLWFVKRGSLGLSNQCGNKVAHPGDFAITRSMSPFLIECNVDEEGVNQTLHVTVPTHILRAHITRALVDCALQIIGHAVKADSDGIATRQTIADRRLDEVLRFIEVHLSDPQLSTTMVARGCGISPRYLSFLLRLKGTSFSELVWEQRLEKARSWLTATDARDISISEIAYGVGFKSPAHFSRMFKRVFNKNPREYRGLADNDAEQPETEIALP
jgi:AraC-like DNA-binding protein